MQFARRPSALPGAGVVHRQRRHDRARCRDALAARDGVAVARPCVRRSPALAAGRGLITPDRATQSRMRALIDQLPASKIREVANAAMGRRDVLAFWFGESDEATPQFIRDAAARSISEGETFYSHN